MLRVTMKAQDGSKFVVYADKPDEIKKMEQSLNATMVSFRESDQSQMLLEQFLVIKGATNQQSLADYDPLNGPGGEWE